MDLNEPSNTESLLNSFIEITSASKEEALFFLESHQWNLDSALSTFLDNHHNQNPTANPPSAPSAAPNPAAQIAAALPEGDEDEEESDYSPSQSPSRSRSRSSSPLPSRSAPYQLRSRGGGGNKKESSAAGGSGSRTTRSGIRTLADLNRAPDGGSGSDEDDDDDEEPQEYYTGGEKSGMLVQDPTRGRGGYDVDSIFDQARQSGGVAERPPVSASSSRSFTGTGRLLSGETVSHAPQDQPPESVAHTVTFWRNGFTVDNGPLRRLDDPANVPFLESIQRSECPRELEPADRRTKVHLDLVRREENYTEPKKPKASFQGVGRTLGGSSGASSSEETVPAASLLTAPSPATGLVVDSSSPSTSIQLRLADGTRMVSRFNLHHRIRDIRAFIDASRPGSASNYQLQTVGFPPKQLSDADQTIEQAGIANSVVIQKI